MQNEINTIGRLLLITFHIFHECLLKHYYQNNEFCMIMDHDDVISFP